MNVSKAAEVLALHQRAAMGMTGGSPDVCNCGERIMPIPPTDDMDIIKRRDAAVAYHQAAVLKAELADTSIPIDAKRPEPGKLKIGDRVVVIDPDSRTRRGVGATVTHVGRAWITVLPDGWNGTIRMRMDEQSQGTRIGYGGYRFVTPEQHEFDMRERAAHNVLRDAGISLSYAATHGPGFAIRLADYVQSLLAETGKPSSV